MHIEYVCNNHRGSWFLPASLDFPAGWSRPFQVLHLFLGLCEGLSRRPFSFGLGLVGDGGACTNLSDIQSLACLTFKVSSQILLTNDFIDLQAEFTLSATVTNLNLTQYRPRIK
jgi:hypothetical protein